jgi:hypothetical protein
MSHTYKGSTFGLNTSSSSSTVARKPAHLATHPLNPWFLSNGIPDFSPQVDKNYEILTTKRKLSELIDEDESNERNEGVKNGQKENNAARTGGAEVDEKVAIEDKDKKKQNFTENDVNKVDDRMNKKARSSDEVTKTLVGGNEKVNGKEVSTPGKVSQSKTNIVPTPTTASPGGNKKSKNANVSAAQALLKSLKSEKAKSKLLEDKIMSNFTAKIIVNTRNVIRYVFCIIDIRLYVKLSSPGNNYSSTL